MRYCAYYIGSAHVIPLCLCVKACIFHVTVCSFRVNTIYHRDWCVLLQVFAGIKGLKAFDSQTVKSIEHGKSQYDIHVLKAYVWRKARSCLCTHKTTCKRYFRHQYLMSCFCTILQHLPIT